MINKSCVHSKFVRDASKCTLPNNNELTIKTGRNLFQHAYVDYDDIEIAGLRFEIKDKNSFAYK